jgi:hypothetical protein
MKKKQEAVKTTIRLPHAIWHAARVRALDERLDFQDFVAAALEAYLKKPSSTKEGQR